MDREYCEKEKLKGRTKHCCNVIHTKRAFRWRLFSGFKAAFKSELRTKLLHNVVLISTAESNIAYTSLIDAIPQSQGQ